MDKSESPKKVKGGFIMGSPRTLGGLAKKHGLRASDFKRRKDTKIKTLRKEIKRGKK